MSRSDIDVGTLRDRVGQEVAVGDWVAISQARVDQFADVTDDHQWIHVDTARAEAESPFKTTVAHGFLTLSLVSSLLRDAIRVSGLRMSLNYGLNRVRFVSPVPTGSRLRGRFTVGTVEDVDDDGVQTMWRITVEREGGQKPALVAEWIVRYYRDIPRSSALSPAPDPR
ncbi:MAG TPA: MaoC family dehydratase [Vicinamibacterales bacterium]|nr:MaoC family dehydratase [Vicinamibacterales bacterium]